jgi:NADP-dependent 3-hydroxy acid dehydrogenase YdfG
MAAFNGQVAVVTGASSGIGKAIALRLALQGARLCLVGRDRDALALVAEQTRPADQETLAYQADLARDEQIDGLAARLEQDVGRVDILIHSAGVIALSHLDRALVEEFDRQYRINVRAPFLLTQRLLPMLLDRQGQIVFINSSAGLRASAGAGQYAATKHALKALADSLREEVNAAGVRVISIFPGRTASPMQAHVHAHEGRAYLPERLLQPDDVAAVVVHALGLPATAEVTDVSVRPLKKRE